jgi:uncharacterized membrane protein
VIHGWVGQVHTWLAVLALLLGGFIFPWAKGTRRHKIFGYGYAGRNDGHDRFRLHD